MRFILILNIIISASLLPAKGNVFAATSTGKVTKYQKLKLLSTHKNVRRAPRDIWERIRIGMHLPLPQPLDARLLAMLKQEAPDLSTLPEKTSQSKNNPALKKPLSIKKTNHKSQNTVQCEQGGPAKSASIEKTEPVITRNRVHVSFDVKPKNLQSIPTIDPENFSPDDAIEAKIIEAAIDEITGKQSTPCTNNQAIAITDPLRSEPSIEALSRQAQNYARVNEYIVRYTQNPDYLLEVTERARPYLYHIVEKLSKSNMPMELALLPIVESAYLPTAESPKNAAGLWQFIPSTGKDFNLEQTSHYDDRLDITASTEAAIRYLSFLKQHFHGDWLLALAAYNCGQGAVDDAINRNLANGSPADFWSLELPEETRAYVPRLLALSSIFANPSAYHLKTAKINNEPYFVKVNISQEIDIKHLIDIDFKSIAKLADLSHYQFSQLNPGYLSDTLHSEQPFTFLIPVNKAKPLNQRLHALATMLMDTPKPGLPLAYVPTLLTESALTRFSFPYLSLNPDNSKRVISQLEKINLTPELIAAKPAVKAANPQNATLHTLIAGETILTLAKRYNVSEDSIRTINKLDRHQNISLGKRLKIPAKKLTVAMLDEKTSQISLTTD